MSSVLSASQVKEGKGETLGNVMANDLEQNEINVNFEDVNFFDKQTTSFQVGGSQASSFVSKDQGRISGDGPSAPGSFVNQDGFDNSFQAAGD